MSRSSRKSTKAAPVIIGGGRYVVVRPGQAEIAFVVVDAYQARGIGTILMRHLGQLARDAGLEELTVEVSRKTPNFGFQLRSQRPPQIAL